MVPMAGRAEGFLGTDAAVAALRAGGLNLYVRHGITDRRQIDTGRRGDRAGQRNLDDRGRAQAAAVGQALRALQICVQSVAASEVFRARDTAALAFPDQPVVVIPALIADDYTPGNPLEDAAEVRRLLAERLAPSAVCGGRSQGNAVFVGHIVPFGMITGRSWSQAAFPEGAIALFRPEAGRAVLIGVVPAEAVIRAAGLSTPWAP